jgi:putative transposase
MGASCPGPWLSPRWPASRRAAAARAGQSAPAQPSSWATSVSERTWLRREVTRARSLRPSRRRSSWGVVRLAGWVGPWQPAWMTTPNPYRGFRFPAEVIEHAVWLYHCFSLSLRDVETILATRGIVVSYESIREWGLRFGQMFANALKRRRPRPGDKWFLDEVLILSANSGGCCQGGEARHARLGAWPAVQPVHHP